MAAIQLKAIINQMAETKGKKLTSSRRRIRYATTEVSPGEVKRVRILKPPTISQKTCRQKRIMNEYYESNKSFWPQKDLKAISLRIGLTSKQVYKYLWYKRSKEEKKRKAIQATTRPSDPLNDPQENQQAIEYKKFTINKITLQIPQNVLFASEFYFLESQEVPEQALQMLKEGGFSLILERL